MTSASTESEVRLDQRGLYKPLNQEVPEIMYE